LYMVKGKGPYGLDPGSDVFCGCLREDAMAKVGNEARALGDRPENFHNTSYDILALEKQIVRIKVALDGVFLRDPSECLGQCEVPIETHRLRRNLFQAGIRGGRTARKENCIAAKVGGSFEKSAVGLEGLTCVFVGVENARS
jgi:hypothetical protein